MIFEPLPIADAVVVRAERAEDDRGWFQRVFSDAEFAENGLAFVPIQVSVAHNEHKGTLRGMHLQAPPHTEAKLVSCLRGSVYDVVVDLRRSSPTHGRWCSVELSETRSEALFVPPGLAHGYQTLVRDTTLLYMMSTAYAPESAWGVRWNDPFFAIEWPAGDKIISAHDRSWPDYAEDRAG